MSHETAEALVLRVVRHLERRRLELGYSKRALAIKAGVDPRTVGLIERGERSPTVFTVALLAGALELPLKDLFS